jgi:hypothetical protein
MSNGNGTDRVIPGRPIAARAINAPGRILARLARWATGAGLGAVDTPVGRVMRPAGGGGLWVTLAGAANPYDATEAVPKPDGTWVAGHRAWTAAFVELAGEVDLAGVRLWAEPDGASGLRGRYRRAGKIGPCAMVCITVRGCHFHLLAGAVVTFTQGGVTQAPQTTGSTGRVCFPATDGVFSYTVSKARFVTRTGTGTAVCPPPAHPVTYGPLYPATLGSDGSIGSVAWTSPGNAGAHDGVVATSTSLGGVPTQYLKGTDYGFAVPTDGTEVMLAVRLGVDVSASAAATDADVRLVVGGAIGGPNLAVGASIPGAGNYVLTTGLPTIAQVDDAGFGFAWAGRAPGTGGGMSTLVQGSAMATGLSATPTRTISATTAGNWLVATVQANAGTITAPAGWSTAVNTTLANPVAIFFKENIAGGLTSISASLSASTRWLMAVEEWSGIATSSSLGQTATATGTSGAPTSGTITTTNADDLVVALIGIGNADTLSAPSGGFALQCQAVNGAAQSLGMLHQVVSATGSYAAGATSSGVDPYSGAIASFQTAPSVPTTLSVDDEGITVTTSRITYEVTIKLDPAPGYQCIGDAPINPVCQDPFPTTLHLTDSVYGSATLTATGSGAWNSACFSHTPPGHPANNYQYSFGGGIVVGVGNRMSVRVAHHLATSSPGCVFEFGACFPNAMALPDCTVPLAFTAAIPAETSCPRGDLYPAGATITVTE